MILFEGGTAEERKDLAFFWAACMVCSPGRPACLSCPACTQVDHLVHQDVILLDGAEDKISIDSVRELKPLMGQAPKGSGYRVMIFAEAQELTVSAANALLKSLEEPAPKNVFVLTVPQREKLLPTLVSRSWCLTLRQAGGQASQTSHNEIQPWVEALFQFSRSGRSWFSRTGTKGAVDAALVRHVLGQVQAACRTAMGSPSMDAGQSDPSMHTPSWGFRVNHLVDRAEESLQAQVNPALVLDCLAVALWREARNERVKG